MYAVPADGASPDQPNKHGQNDNRAVQQDQADPLAASLSGLSAGRLPSISRIYPDSRRDDLVEMLHGRPVADPYRWLESMTSPETRQWIHAQNALTQDYLQAVPEREEIRQRLSELWNFERYTAPTERGGRYFYFKNDGLQNHAVLYVSDSPEADAPSRPLIDPNTLSQGGTVALANLSISPDGKLVAYATSKSGSDWLEWRVRDASSGADLPDKLEWVKFSGVSWSADSQSMYYGRYPEPLKGEELSDANRFHKLYVHALGTSQSEDQLVHERPDQPDWIFGGDVSDDGRYLIVYVSCGSASENGIYFKDLQGGADVAPLFADFDGEYSILGNDGPVFFVSTTADAPKGRIVAVDVTALAQENWRELVPESDCAISSARLAGGKIVVTYMRDAREVISIHAKDGTFEREVALPGVGSVSGVTGKPESKELFYSYASFVHPAAIYRCNLDDGTSSLFRGPALKHDPADYEEKQIRFPSKDGTEVPMFVVHKKGIVLDGTNPALLYGYGGFDHSLPPAFSVANLAWVERGGIYAQPSLRGGGEYGRAWHEAGMREKKQNVFDDFISAAEWLIGAGYTSPAHLAIKGGSNGGLLVGACMCQRPELFGAALPQVGVMDMLRFHKFTIGKAWCSEYGTPDDAADFQNLLAYSPLHNLSEGRSYPATLVMTSDHDDRVVPAHSYKFAAALQYAQAGEAPCLIRIETEAGHGAGVPLSKTIDAAADQIAFLTKALGIGEH